MRCVVIQFRSGRATKSFRRPPEPSALLSMGFQWLAKQSCYQAASGMQASCCSASRCLVMVSTCGKKLSGSRSRGSGVEVSLQPTERRAVTQINITWTIRITTMHHQQNHDYDHRTHLGDGPEYEITNQCHHCLIAVVIIFDPNMYHHGCYYGCHSHMATRRPQPHSKHMGRCLNTRKSSVRARQ